MATEFFIISTQLAGSCESSNRRWGHLGDGLRGDEMLLSIYPILHLRVGQRGAIKDAAGPLLWTLEQRQQPLGR